MEEMFVLTLIIGHEPPKATVEGSKPRRDHGPVANGFEAAGSYYRMPFSSSDKCIVADEGGL
jgi:hypothetical protein